MVLFWGLNFAVIKIPLAAMHPFTVNLFRFVVSAGVLGGLALAEARKQEASWLAPWQAGFGYVLALGLLGHAAYQCIFILGVGKTSAGSASLLIASSPLWVALLSHTLGHERLRAGAWVGFALCLTGVAVVVGADEEGLDLSGEALVGNGMMLASSMVWAGYTLVSRPLLQRGVSAVSLSFHSVTVALPVLAALGLATWDETDWARVDGWTWAALLFSGGLSTGLAYAIWNAGIRHVGAAQTSAFSYLVPLVALLAGLVLLREPITVAQVGGGTLILAGLLLIRRFRTLQ